MEIRYTKESIKFLAKLDKKSVVRIREGIEGLTKLPPEGDIKVMKGRTDGTKRLRIGSWRVLFRYDADGGIEVLLVLSIGNRGDVYKGG